MRLYANFRIKARALVQKIGFIRYHLNMNKPTIFIEQHKRATAEAISIIDRLMPDAHAFTSRYNMLDFALNKLGEGLIAEFGVHNGTSINYMARKTSRIIHGFDSFEGLPESWSGVFSKGTFNLDGKEPKVRKNVKLYKGFFSETLPLFLEKNKESFAFIHIDADLYSSTKCIFDLIKERIKSGTIIQFDEFFNYPGWQRGEYRAFEELKGEMQFNIEYLGYTGISQVLLKIID